MTVEQALHNAIAHHQAGELKDAERLYRAILHAQPNHPDANHNLGVLAVQIKQPAAGLPHLRTALEANPNQGRYWLSYIDALIQTGQTDSARQLLVQGRQRGLQGEALEALAGRLDHTNKNATPVHSSEHESAIAHREAGRYKEAQLVLEGGLVSNPKNASAYALLAQVLSLDKQEEPARAALRTAMSINPTLPIVQRNHARLLLKQQKLDEALQAAKTAYQSDATDPENQLVLAAALGANNLNEPAITLVGRALQNRPHYAEAFATRALLRLRGNDIVGAVDDAEMALSLKPHLTHLWGMVGSLRHQLKNMPGAIAALEKAHDYEPDNVAHMVNLGEFKRQSGEVEAAIVLLEKAAAIAPGNSSVWVNLGTAFQQVQRISEAKICYSKALEIAPEQAEVASNLGALAKEEENWQEALRYFDQALALQPNRVAIMTNRAVALNALEQHDEAEYVARCAIEAEPANPEAHLALAIALIGQKQYATAQSVLDTQNTPNLGDIGDTHRLALSYAALFSAQNRWTEAEACVRRALVIKAKDVKSLRQLGTILDEQNRYEEAWAVFQATLENSPEDANTLLAMASHHVRLVHWVEAEAWVRRALAVKPKDVKVLRQLGAVLDEQRRYEDALAVFQAALEISPEDGVTMQAMVSHHAMQEHWAEAEAWVRQALAVKPKDVKVLRQLGEILEEQKRYEDARAVIQEAFENSPGDADTMYAMASHHAKQEHWQKAEAWIRRALAIKPDFAEVYCALGNIAHNQGRLEEAEQSYRRAIEVSPDFAKAHYYLGITLKYQGRLDEAIASCRKALAIKPDFAEAYNDLGNTLSNLGNLDEAIASYLNALKYKSNFALAYFHLHPLLLSPDDVTPAIECLEKAVEIEPSNAKFRFFMGMMLDYIGNRKEAADHFDWVEKSTGLPQAWLDAWRYLKSAKSAINKHPLLTGSNIQTFRIGIDAAVNEGLVMEFGVRFGSTIRQIAALVDQEVHGFDSFEGLPEQWHDEPKGSYSTNGVMPSVPGNVSLYAGWFEDTLPQFLENHTGPVRFMNIDCDIYSSTKTVLDHLADRIVPGTVIVFDEYIGNEFWREDEFKAFREAVVQYNWQYEYICFSFFTKQVVIRILNT